MDDGENFIGDQGRQPQAGFVEQQQARIGHQSTSHGQHLLLAAGQGASGLAAAFGQALEAVENGLHALLDLPAAGSLRCRPQFEVFGNAQVGKDLATLGGQGQAAADHLGR